MEILTNYSDVRINNLFIFKNIIHNLLEFALDKGLNLM